MNGNETVYCDKRAIKFEKKWSYPDGYAPYCFKELDDEGRCPDHGQIVSGEFLEAYRKRKCGGGQQIG